MGLFLKILGGLFLTLILLLVLGFFYVRYRIRKALKTLGGAFESLAAAVAAEQPTTITMRKVGSVEWKDREAVEAKAAPLSGLGFQDAGVYEIEEILGLKLWAFVNLSQSIYAVVYEHTMAGVWLDCVTQYEDGTGITHSTAPHGEELDQRPGHEKVYLAGADAKSLLESFLAARSNRAMKPVSAQAFAPTFEKAYEDEMAWRNVRGGPTEREMRAIAAKSGIVLGEEEFEAARDRMHEQAVQGLNAVLRERFLETTSMPAREWEELRERLVFVHDHMSSRMVDELAREWEWCSEDEDEDEDEDEEDFNEDEDEDEDEDDPSPLVELRAGETAREAFRRYNEGLPTGSRFEKVGEVSDPVAADVYRAPE